MIVCYHCHAQLDDLQDIVAHCKNQQSDVSGNFSFRNFVKTKNIYQYYQLVYEPGTLTGTSQRDKLP